MQKTLLTIIAVFIIVITSIAQEKNVAVIAPFDHEDKVQLMYENLIKSKLTEIIAETEGYKAFSRTDLNTIIDEHHFQRTGVVKDDEIRRIGEMTGATHVCVSEVSTADDYMTIAARIIEIETAEVMIEKSEFVKADPEAINIGCITLAYKLVGRVVDFISDVGVGDSDISFSDYNKPSLSTGFSDYNEKVAGIEIEMVAVAGGTFQMGCTNEQTNCYDNEKPVHTVSVEDYYIGRFEISQMQWQAIMGTNPSSKSKGFGGIYPVNNVSWNDVQSFLIKLNQLTNKRYRLPTEAEWEYAARGGDKSKGFLYSGSNDIKSVAWYTGNSKNKAHPVGQNLPNELDIYDMSGNVWEWCASWYARYSKDGEDANPSNSDRIIRGGGWLSQDRKCRVVTRDYTDPDDYDDNIGFRIAFPR